MDPPEVRARALDHPCEDADGLAARIQGGGLEVAPDGLYVVQKVVDSLDRFITRLEFVACELERLAEPLRAAAAVS